MSQSINLKTIILAVRKWIGLAAAECSFPVVVLALLCFALSPEAQAVSPVPDGGYPGNNTAEGNGALFSLTSGSLNTANGAFALFFNTSGSNNTAEGAGALVNNTSGNNNTANGVNVLYFNTIGGQNTATGFEALFSNTTGAEDNAFGSLALSSNNDGIFNNAFGRGALEFNVDGVQNNAFGDEALSENVSGSFNTGIGDLALFFSTGDSNVAVGEEAGIGITIGNNIIAIGTGVSGISTVGGEVDDSCYIGNIIDAPVDPGTAQSVFVDADGKPGTTAFSSQGFKKEIRPMGQTSEAVLALKPVTFQYNSDKKDTPQFGLIAEDVAEVNADLVVRDKNGGVLAVRYDAVTAMLLNEFLKEHRKVKEQDRKMQEQEATIDQLISTVAQQQKGMDVLTASVKEQGAQIRKVNERLEHCVNPFPLARAECWQSDERLEQAIPLQVVNSE
jgi:hypothetical protein